MYFLFFHFVVIIFFLITLSKYLANTCRSQFESDVSFQPALKMARKSNFLIEHLIAWLSDFIISLYQY